MGVIRWGRERVVLVAGTRETGELGKCDGKHQRFSDLARDLLIRCEVHNGVDDRVEPLISEEEAEQRHSVGCWITGACACFCACWGGSEGAAGRCMGDLDNLERGEGAVVRRSHGNSPDAPQKRWNFNSHVIKPSRRSGLLLLIYL